MLIAIQLTNTFLQQVANKCAHKFGRWYDMIWMEKILGDHVANPEPFMPFTQVAQEKIDEVLEQA